MSIGSLSNTSEHSSWVFSESYQPNKVLDHHNLSLVYSNAKVTNAVYALWHGSHLILSLLFLLFTLELVSCLVLGAEAITSLKYNSNNCLVIERYPLEILLLA